MAFTQAQVDAMREAYAAGLRSVTFEGRTFTYDSNEALGRALTRMENNLLRQAGRRVRQTRLSSSKGF